MLNSIFKFHPVLSIALSGLFLFPALARASIVKKGHESVVKVYVTSQRSDFAVPWQSRRPERGFGSAFVIKGRRLLTNAHIVGDTRFLQVQKHGDSARYQARVKHIAHDCDLAVLEVLDPRFMDGTRPLELADTLPQLNEEVIVLGYPVGGERLSLTKGVVSRLSYAGYTHSGVDHHLALQVDAAINPGNSGGPVMQDGRVVGLAFQGLAWADGIGYAIPLPVIRHFLEDIDDGTYNGYPELGVVHLNLRNSAMRKHLALPAKESGVVIYYLDPYGSAWSRARTGDIILSIDGHDVDNDGTILLDYERLPFTEILERKQWGEAIALEVWRDGDTTLLKIPLDNPSDPFVYRNSYGKKPKYTIHGGLIFSPMSREYVRTLDRGDQSRNVQMLHYLFEYTKIDGLYEDRDELVILIDRLAHPVNTYMQHFVNGAVESVNGVPIPNMEALHKAFQEPEDGYFIIRFLGKKDILVLDAAAAELADAEILTTYRIPQRQFLGEQK